MTPPTSGAVKIFSRSRFPSVFRPVWPRGEIRIGCNKGIDYSALHPSSQGAALLTIFQLPKDACAVAIRELIRAALPGRRRGGLDTVSRPSQEKLPESRIT